MAHVFISYKHEDLAFAKELTLLAQKEGVVTWLDTHIQPGDEWWQAIDDAITAAFALVVVMTPEARLSEYITYEWAFAMGLRIPIILEEIAGGRTIPELLQHYGLTREEIEAALEYAADTVRAQQKPSA